MNDLRFGFRQFRNAPAFTEQPSRRSRSVEIGVRMALGAQFLSLGLRLLVAGIILGLFGAWLMGRAMQSVLFDVPPLHLMILLGTAAMMSMASLLACLIPAWRASTVNPVEALRTE